MPTKAQLINGINLASAHLVRSVGPGLSAEPNTGAIVPDPTIAVVGQTVGDAPIVCVVPLPGSIISHDSPVADEMGVTYTPVRLSDGLDGYKYYQPNNNYYAQIEAGRLQSRGRRFTKIGK